MPLEPGTLLFNRYRIIDILGQGGMGSVYRATDENLGVCVAVKENLFLSDEYARQFRLEANILAGLRHPCLPRVGDHFVIDRQGQYLVMDYIEGDDLRQLMDRSGALAENEVIRIGVAICDALSYLHTRVPAVVHRDIKPGNIKLTSDGQVILVDFGLAKIMVGNEATTTGARAMTPGYSPPEQYGTAHTDPRSDVYSLGATLYVALTNVVPEDGLARLTGNAVLTNPRKLNTTVNRKLTSAVVKALAVDPDARYQTADDFKQALLDAQSEPNNGSSSRPVSRPSGPYGENVLSEIGSSLPGAGEFFANVRSFFADQWKWVLGGFIVLVLAVIIGIFGSRGGSSGFFFPAVYRQASSTPPPPTQPLKKSPTSTKVISTAAALVKTTVMPTLLVSTAVATQTPVITPTPYPVADKSEQIAFVSERSGKPQLWLMNSDGSNQHPITTMADGACQPDWSPDGKRLVFISPCPSMMKGRYVRFPGSSLHIINSDGTGVVDLPLAPEGDFDPVWSPDGNKIAFTSLKDGHPQIYLLYLDTRTRQDISYNNYEDRQPAWSPDGKLLAFVRLYGSDQIWIMRSDGSDPKQATRSNEITNDLWPAWTPDGAIIFFGQTDQNAVLPWLMAIRYEDISTNKEFKVPALRQTDFGYVAQVRVSPDNHWIAFEGWSGPDSHEIWIMTVAGAERQRLTNNTDLDYSPVWRPIVK